MNCTSETLYCSNPTAPLPIKDNFDNRFCSVKCFVDHWSELFQQQLIVRDDHILALKNGMLARGNLIPIKYALE